MTEKIDLKTETKNKILAILLTIPRGCSVNQLQNDYQSFIGCPLPYRQLGYVSAQEFLTDIPDVVHVTWSRDNQLILRGISNTKTDRVNNLIQKNKTSKRTCRSRGGARGRGGGSRRYPTGGSRRPPLLPDPIVPPFIRAQIREVLHSYPNGLLGFTFNEAFARRFGNQLMPQRLGFTSMGDLLRSVADIARMEEMRGGGFRIFLRAGHASAAPPRGNLSGESERGTGARREPISQKGVCEVRRSQPLTKRGGPQRGGPPPSAHRNPLFDFSSDDGGHSSDEFEIADDGTGIDDELKSSIKQVLNSRPSGIWAAQFPTEFRRLTRKSLPLKELGYLSVVELVSSIPEVVTIERPTSKGDWMLYDASIHKPHAEPVTPEEPVLSDKVHFSTAPSIDAVLRERIRQVLLTQPGGVALKDFLQLYKGLTAESLPIGSLGFASLDALVISLVDVVLQMKYEGDGMVKLFPMDLSKPKVNLLMNRGQGSSKKKGIPPDAVGPGVGFVPVDPPEDTQYLEIFVSNITSPAKFWFQIKGDHTTMALEEMMDRLEEVYKGQDGDNYIIPDTLIMIGQVCAALFPEDENWHRASITGIPNMDFVEVYFVDYGNTCSVPRSSLRMLKNRFLKLATQAIRGRLSHIAPAEGSQWSRKSANRMLQLCANRPMVALVTSNKDRVFSLCLCDTTTEVDIHINDLLVTEGYAIMRTDSDQQLSPVEQTAAPVEHTPGAMEQTYTPNPPLATVAPLPQEALAGQSISVSESDLTPRYIRSIQLTEDYSIHIVNLEDKPYVISGDISAFFWKKDILRSMLRQKKLSVPKLVLSQEEHPDLFDEIQNYQLKGMINDGEVRSHATFYDLTSVVEILRSFDHPSSALTSAIQEQIGCFDPSDGYWKGQEFTGSEDDDETTSEDMSDECHSLNELQEALEVLQFRRKRILQQMIEECSEQLVEELHDVEINIQNMRSRVKDQEAREAVRGQDHSGVQSEAAEEDVFIQECVAQQYKMAPVGSERSAVPSTSSPLKVTHRVAPMVSATSPTSKSQPATPAASAPAPNASSTVLPPDADLQKLIDQTSSMMLGGMPFDQTMLSSAEGTAYDQSSNMMLSSMGGMSHEQQQILYQNLLMNQAYVPMLPLTAPMVTMPTPQQTQSMLMGLGALSLAGGQASLGMPPMMTPGVGLLGQGQLQPGLTSALGQGRGLMRAPSSGAGPDVGSTQFHRYQSPPQ